MSTFEWEAQVFNLGTGQELGAFIDLWEETAIVEI